MKKKLLAISMLLTVAILSPIGSAWSVADASDAKTVKQQSLSITDVQKAVANATGYETENIKIESTVNKVTITVVDNTLNSGASKDRESEAIKVASSLANAISEKAEFAQVMIIHVDYVKPSGNKRAIEVYDFYKTPSGVFVIHKA